MIASEREHLRSLLKDLEAGLSIERASNVAAWFRALEEVAKDAGLLWVVAEPPPRSQLLGSPISTKIVLDQETVQGGRVRRMIVDPPVEQTSNIFEVRLLASGARLYFGTGHPGSDRESNSDSTCEDFLIGLADIADTALFRLASVPGTEDPWNDSARDHGAHITLTLSARAVLHQIVNMAKDITSGISHLTDAHESGNLRWDETEARLVKAIGESAEQLLNLLGGMGYLVDATRRTSLREVVEQSAGLHRLPLASYRVNLQVDIAPEILVDVPFHVALFAFANLIGNAIQAIAKTGRGSTISIVAKAAADGVYCHVSDNGPGVPEEIRDKLFDKGITTKAYSGGWGLYLVSRSLREYRGDIELSNPGPGRTTFTMRFPLARQE